MKTNIPAGGLGQQRGFFDVDERLQELSAKGDALERLSELLDYEEVETDKLNSRPALAQALAACRAMHATLIVAKLDRLDRNAAFLLSVVERSG